MSKEFNLNNPAKRFLSDPLTDNTDKNEIANRDSIGRVQNTADEETKSKRVNFLVKPSVYDDFKKIATMEQESVNGLINLVMEQVVKDNQDKIDLYDKVFPNNDE